MVAMVVTERHLWVNMANIGEKKKGFVLDVPVSPSELFGLFQHLLRWWSISLRRRRRRPQTLKHLYCAGPGLLLRPNSWGVVARRGLTTKDWARRLVLPLWGKGCRGCEEDARKKKHDFREVIQSRTDEVNNIYPTTCSILAQKRNMNN